MNEVVTSNETDNVTTYIYILVASEICGGLANALPFLWWRTESFVAKALGLGPNSGIYYSDDDVTFNGRSFHLEWQANKVPGPSSVKLVFFTWKHRNYSFHFF